MALPSLVASTQSCRCPLISSPTMAELRTQYATSKQEVERLLQKIRDRERERVQQQLAKAEQAWSALYDDA